MQPTVDLTEMALATQDISWRSLPAAQQPNWRTHPDYPRVRRALATAAPLVTRSEIAAAHRSLAAVAAGSTRLLQVGDCAERFADARPNRTSAKVALINQLGDLLDRRTGQQVVRFGRMAGQYAKPRSNPVDTIDGVQVPAYRGDLVNSSDPYTWSRRHDPDRMLRAYDASGTVLRELRAHWAFPGTADHLGPWSSHEALVIDYESPQIHTDPVTGHDFLASTHFPWIGERTRQLDHAHVTMLASVRNPVGCKIGPDADPMDVVRLCGLLDPDRVPGRLTLIVRMGQHVVLDALPAIASAVRRAGHPVVWVSDPMHGNTVRTSSGRKTRYLDDLVAETLRFRRVLEGLDLHAGGLHLEVAATQVTECVGGRIVDEFALRTRYESVCDPRLNPAQAVELIERVF